MSAIGIPIIREKLTLSVPEAAEQLGVSTTTMYRIARIKGFPAIRLGRRILVSKKQLPIWVEEMAKKGWGVYEL